MPAQYGWRTAHQHYVIDRATWNVILITLGARLEDAQEVARALSRIYGPLPE